MRPARHPQRTPMTAHPTSKALKRNAVRAMQDEKLQRALAHVRTNFTAKRQAAVARLPEFEALRDAARDIKDHTLAHLDLYLERYEAIVRAPVRGTYRSYDVVSMPPPSSGGVHLIEMLNVLEGFPPREFSAPTPANLHLMIETMKLAYADRAEYLGDSDAVDVPIARLISKTYADELRATIDRQKARPALDIRAGAAPRSSGGNTTHYNRNSV